MKNASPIWEYAKMIHSLSKVMALELYFSGVSEPCCVVHMFRVWGILYHAEVPLYGVCTIYSLQYSLRWWCSLPVSVPAIYGVTRWIRRVWFACQEHIVACREEGGREEWGGREGVIEAATQRAVQEVRDVCIVCVCVCVCVYMCVIRRQSFNPLAVLVQVTESFQYCYTLNVAVAELMTLSNTLKANKVLRGRRPYHTALETLCLLLAPIWLPEGTHT